MAATEEGSDDAPRAQVAPAGALLAAALALPGMVPGSAIAQTAPDQGLIALKYVDYRDWQPGADRIRVHSPSLYVLKPLSDTLAAEGSLVYDSISGASPLYHNTLSGASGKGGVVDYRTAGDVKLTRYFDGAAVGIGAAISSERDYLSRAVSVDARISSADRNRTYAFGVGGASDNIDSTNGLAEGKHRRTVELLFGVTQVLSAQAIVQSNLTYSDGHGYFSDPYKTIDIRPDRRRVLAWLTRYNQRLPRFDATVSLSYRYVNDSFGSDSHTLEAAWFQPLPRGWSIKPSLRYYTQAAADFYFDPPFPQGFSIGAPYTADARLSAFGAVTPGITVAKALPDGWTVDLKVEYYRQRPDWRPGGGSPGLLPLSARWIQTGISKTF
ncbi:MAG TPA: DUF3570 domain-containing protein [Casimicrobiaceae bacterium]|nr:DUF3570 domain-containing protein [Casimicrobiaceae bacterium]